MSQIENSPGALRREIFELNRIIDGSKWALAHGKAPEADIPMLRREIERRSALRAHFQQLLDRLPADIPVEKSG